MTSLCIMTKNGGQPHSANAHTEQPTLYVLIIHPQAADLMQWLCEVTQSKCLHRLLFFFFLTSERHESEFISKKKYLLSDILLDLLHLVSLQAWLMCTELCATITRPSRFIESSFRNLSETLGGLGLLQWDELFLPWTKYPLQDCSSSLPHSSCPQKTNLLCQCFSIWSVAHFS